MAEESEDRASPERISYFLSGLPAQEHNTIRYAKLVCQACQSGALRSLSDDFTTRARILVTELRDGVQKEFMTFAGNEITNGQNGGLSFCPILCCEKQSRIDSVVDDNGRNRDWQPVCHFLPNSLADADYAPRIAVHVLRDPLTPSARETFYLSSRVRIPTVYGDDKGNSYFAAKERCSMSAGQRGMRMDQIDRLFCMQSPHHR
jgi:hypothetical protein